MLKAANTSKYFSGRISFRRIYHLIISVNFNKLVKLVDD